MPGGFQLALHWHLRWEDTLKIYSYFLYCTNPLLPSWEFFYSLLITFLLLLFISMWHAILIQSLRKARSKAILSALYSVERDLFFVLFCLFFRILNKKDEELRNILSRQSHSVFTQLPLMLLNGCHSWTNLNGESATWYYYLIFLLNESKWKKCRSPVARSTKRNGKTQQSLWKDEKLLWYLVAYLLH